MGYEQKNVNLRGRWQELFREFRVQIFVSRWESTEESFRAVRSWGNEFAERKPRNLLPKPHEMDAPSCGLLRGTWSQNTRNSTTDAHGLARINAGNRRLKASKERPSREGRNGTQRGDTNCSCVRTGQVSFMFFNRIDVSDKTHIARSRRNAALLDKGFCPDAKVAAKRHRSAKEQ
jgi:hypothetical protein